ncbi:hypothetical protein B566_EDAN008793 [Ephemera danica]|nr:hypothetical protein B566_EDAN008793 [Ephemera danica]
MSTGSSTPSSSRSTPSPQPLTLNVEPLEYELNRQLLADFTGERTGYVQVGPDKWFLPTKYSDHAANFLNFEVRPDDVWVVTFPRSGTTWTQELVWLVANDLDFDFAKRVPQVQRFPFFEFNIFVHEQVRAELLARNRDDAHKIEIVEELSRPGYEILNATPGPRFIKTHFPFSYIGDFEKYWGYFEKNLLARFLDKSMNEVQVAQLAEHLNITNFRRNPAVNFDLLSEVGLMNDGEQSFIRKGKTGGWREEFTPELNARADKWINDNLNKTDLRFPAV